MTLLTRRTGPFSDLVELQSRFDRMFDDLTDRGHQGRMPAVDLIDEDDAIVIRADVPGVTADEVAVELSEDVLTVRGAHEETSEEKDKRYLRRERRMGSFSRTVAVPPGVDAEAITASCKDGVVEVRIPKPDHTEPRTIAVSSGS